MKSCAAAAELLCVLHRGRGQGVSCAGHAAVVPLIMGTTTHYVDVLPAAAMGTLLSPSFAMMSICDRIPNDIQ